MGSKTPEEELDEFLATQPNWLQKLLQYDLQLTADENWAYLQAADFWNSQNAALHEEYERLCQRVPGLWTRYCKRRKRVLGVFAATSKPGRPRKDALAEEATLLYQSGRNYQQIAIIFKEKYEADATPDAIRKLIASRRSGSKPEET